MLSYLIYGLFGSIWGWRSAKLTAVAIAKVGFVAIALVVIFTALRVAVPSGLPPVPIIGVLLAIGVTFLSIAFGYLVGALAKRTRIKNDAADNGQT